MKQDLLARLLWWLTTAFDEIRCARVPNAKVPAIFALSRDENAGHSYLCLNHGADAFAAKSRVFGIPAVLTRARIGKRALLQEPYNSRPNFRVLYGMLPDVTNDLRSNDSRDMILGDEWDRDWLKKLPKADLHFHIGTSISLPTIEALSANSAGYSLQNANRNDNVIQPLLRDVCETVLLANLVTTIYEKSSNNSAAKILWASARFILQHRGDDGQIVSNRVPEKQIFDQVVSWFTRGDRPIQAFESCSLLVSAVCVCTRVMKKLREQEDPPRTVSFRSFADEISEELITRWHALQLLSDVCQLDSASLLEQHLFFMLNYHMRRIEENWSHAQTEATVQEDFPYEFTNGQWPLRLFQRVVRNIRTATIAICTEFDNLLNEPRWIRNRLRTFHEGQGEFVISGEDLNVLIHIFEATSADAFPTRPHAFKTLDLRDLVVLPDPLEGRLADDQRSLARYLWGADLLGAEHLQYPENLLLAGIDIVRQNVCDNVVYSEIRCATNGYCSAGMNQHDATDLLCLAFDLGALLFGAYGQRQRQHAITRLKSACSEELTDFLVSPPSRWVRCNVILGGKRNKKTQIRDVVALVKTYFERGQESPIREGTRYLSDTMSGAWWARCRVVGFDLSGDETQQVADLRDMIAPLFVVCAPITIHAGEAATADSIWQAVYFQGAQRIGHGLRLREKKDLLEFCVRRGICMELCPNSNIFTNIFFDCRNPRPGTSRKSDDLAAADRGLYPLRAFIDAGLDVCLNTDNRSLHKRDTLTDEYMAAAALVGGLTKWEVLKICKADFKSAFLSKSDVATILRHVEYQIFKLVSDGQNEKDFPPVGTVAVKNS